jgi:hypothetical protein
MTKSSQENCEEQTNDTDLFSLTIPLSLLQQLFWRVDFPFSLYVVNFWHYETFENFQAKDPCVSSSETQTNGGGQRKYNT